MPTLNPHLADYLFECHREAPEQGAVGRRVIQYLTKSGQAFEGLNLPTTEKLTREQVRRICQDDNVPVLVAYCAAMAWGGQDLKHFGSSVSDECRMNLEELLKDLRGSKAKRAEDFEKAKKACRQIKGLGISFFTKLLFFFRPLADSYILDQHTAKSVSLLFEESPISVKYHMPHPETNGMQYDVFCKSLELLGQYEGRAWSGEAIERAIFDQPRGQWRKKVGERFPKKKKK